MMTTKYPFGKNSMNEYKRNNNVKNQIAIKSAVNDSSSPIHRNCSVKLGKTMYSTGIIML